MLCLHFGTCGGCTLQDQSPDDYRALKRRGVITALEKVGLGDVPVAQPVMAPLYSRRRAVFKIEKNKGVLEVGFHARGSHQIVIADGQRGHDPVQRLHSGFHVHAIIGQICPQSAHKIRWGLLGEWWRGLKRGSLYRSDAMPLRLCILAMTLSSFELPSLQR